MLYIYTDGQDHKLDAFEADHLLALGLIVTHPGAGHDGIDSEDYKLAEEVDWKDVYAALYHLHPRSRKV